MNKKGAEARTGAAKTADAGKIYTSEYNTVVRSADLPAAVRIFDTTLRDGEQTPGVALSLNDKLKIAEALDTAGVDTIEAGFPSVSGEEFSAIKAIAHQGLSAEICGLARCNKKDIDAALDAGVDCVHVFIATSERHMNHKLKMTPEQVVAKAVEAVEYVKAHGAVAEFSSEDATRSALPFLKDVHTAVQDAGVDRINVPDTVGVVYPNAMHHLISELMTVTKVPISVHCHQDFGLAVANSLAAVEAGAQQVHVTVNGLGERAGNAALEETVASLIALYGVAVNVDMAKLTHVSKLVSRLSGVVVQPNKAIVGDNAFAHESGIHVHGIVNDPSTYEAMSPELVGRDRSIVLGKHTGVHAVREKLDEYGIDYDDAQLREISDKIKQLGESGKKLSDTELVALAYDTVGRKATESDIVQLKEFTVLTGSNITPTSTVAIAINGEVKRTSEIGIGPVDASLSAIQSAVSDDIVLREYRLEAITGGSDALCEVTVKLGQNGHSSLGKSVGPDIILTSVNAAIEALNRLYATKEQKGD